MAAPTRWAIQQIFTQTFKNVENTEVYATLDDLMTCNFANEETIVYSHGGVGDAYITGHSYGKRCTGSASAATFKNEIIGLITGTDPTIGSATVPVNNEIIEITSDTGNTLYTATGTTDAEFVGLFEYQTDGSLGTELTQVSGTPSAGEFSYASGTKTITFSTGEFSDGDKVVAFYMASTGSTASTITNDFSTFSKTVRIEMDTLVQDVCTGIDYAAKIIVFKAKLDGSFAFDLASDGDPATLDVSFEALKGSCTDSRAWDMVVVDSIS